MHLIQNGLEMVQKRFSNRFKAGHVKGGYVIIHIKVGMNN